MKIYHNFNRFIYNIILVIVCYFYAFNSFATDTAASLAASASSNLSAINQSLSDATNLANQVSNSTSDAYNQTEVDADTKAFYQSTSANSQAALQQAIANSDPNLSNIQAQADADLTNATNAVAVSNASYAYASAEQNFYNQQNAAVSALTNAQNDAINASSYANIYATAQANYEAANTAYNNANAALTIAQNNADAALAAAQANLQDSTLAKTSVDAATAATNAAKTVESAAAALSTASTDVTNAATQATNALLVSSNSANVANQAIANAAGAASSATAAANNLAAAYSTMSSIANSLSSVATQAEDKLAYVTNQAIEGATIANAVAEYNATSQAAVSTFNIVSSNATQYFNTATNLANIANGYLPQSLQYQQLASTTSSTLKNAQSLAQTSYNYAVSGQALNQASSVTTQYANKTVNYVTTNYPNVVANITQQYNSLAGSVTDVATDAYDDVSNWASGFFTVNPFSSVPPDFAKCFAEDWSVESVSSSSAFTPKIKVSNRIVIACIGFKGNVTLHGYGQCKFIGLVRVCARNTPPCVHGNDTCCPGTSPYPTTTHKSNACNPPSSSLCPGCKSQSVYRICAFEDPMFPADATDISSSSMAFQRQTAVPPSVTGGDSVIAAGALILAAGLLVPGLGLGVAAIGAGLMLAGGIMDLIQFITSKMNYSVIANHGCVEIPLTPSPPPYCPQINSFLPNPELMSVCQQSPDFVNNVLAPGYTNYKTSKTVNFSPPYPANTQVSTSDTPCEISQYNNQSLFSTFENPVIRLYFNNPLPICSTGYIGTADACIFTKRLSTPLTTWYNDYNLLPVCSDTVNDNCIYFPSGKAPLPYYRPVYNTLNPVNATGTTSPPSTNGPFAVLSPVPQSATTSPPSLEFSGINDSMYADASPGNLVTITDFMQTSRVFLVYFDNPGNSVCVAERVITENTSTSLIETGDGQDIPIGCVPRPTMSQIPIVSSCNLSNDNCSYGSNVSGTKSCFGSAICKTQNNINLSTQPRIKISVGATSPKTASIGVDTALLNPSAANTPKYAQPAAYCAQDDITYNGTTSTTIGTSSSNLSPCSIYGYQVFSAYVTDVYNQTPDSIASSSTTPNYTTNNFNKAGVQYSNGLYCRGATKICLSGYSDPIKTVVAKVITQTNNGSTSNVISNILTDRVIPTYNYNASTQTLASFFDPINQIATTSAPVQRTAIGGYDKGSNIYYENLACTSDSNNSCVANGTPTSGNPVPTTCKCLNNYNSPATLDTCSITGCEWAFITAQTNISIEIGSKNSDGTYIQNLACTNSTDYSCSPPTTCNSSACPAVCSCANNCTTNCASGSYNSSTGNCTIKGCEWAFQPPNTANISTAAFYSYNGNTYPIAGGTACPNGSGPINGGSTCSGSNCPCYGQRTANSLELGLCAPITQPSCPSISHPNINSAGAANDGYANWPTTQLGNNNINVQGSCIDGAVQLNGAPTRSCTLVDSGYEQISNGTSIVNGCPIYTIAYGPITNPCVLPPTPLWWPNQFLANTNYQGAIFNHFNVNYTYYNNNKFIPNFSNYDQHNQKPEQWVNTSYNSCHDYRSNYTLASTPRHSRNGDQEMLFLTSQQWNSLWRDNNLAWTLATPTNLPSGENYSDYNGCKVYDVTNNISATLNGITVGMKICKYNDHISFSLVDTTTCSAMDYTCNKYIMQSNIISYYNNGSDLSLTNSSGGEYINHGIVVNRNGFPGGADYIGGNLPNGFHSISTPESIDIEYDFTNMVKSTNKGSGTSGRNHQHCNVNKASVTINSGCALSVYRSNIINYPYSPTSPASESNGSYIPLTSGENEGSLVNLSLFSNHKQADKFDSQTCSVNVTISNHVAGNSAAYKSMFLWNSPTNYRACNGSVTPPSANLSNQNDGC